MYIMLSNRRQYCSLATALMLATLGSHAFAQPTAPTSQELGAALLRDKYTSLSPALANGVYARPLTLSSEEANSRVTGNVYAELDAPFTSVSNLKNPKHLCDVMILHINTKYCHPIQQASASVLLVNFGKKTPQPLADTFDLEFVMTTNPPSSNYLQASLQAEKGPLGTSNYAIELSAIPLPANKTFLHLRYSYGIGAASRLAMQAYLATTGGNKVGFTEVTDTSQSPGKAKVYIGGMRGAVERNTMRYYLAIEAYLKSLSAPQADQENLRLEKWFDSTEQYPTQLRETDKASYLAMKKDEITRQQTARPRL